MTGVAGTTAPAVRIDACLPSDELARLDPHPELDMFRTPAAQLAALVGIAADRDGCVTTARRDDTLVGYAAFHPPSDVELWSEDRSGRLIELGAVEVAPSLRGERLAERLLEESFAGGRYDATVVFATMYVWHYDLKRTGLSDFGYKRLLDKLYRKAGMTPFTTSDPEIRSSAANELMARIGPEAPGEVVAEFHRLRSKPTFWGV